MTHKSKDNAGFDPSKFSIATARPLPVFLLLDVSGTMNEVVGSDFERTGEIFEDDGKTWERVKGGSSRLSILREAVTKMLLAFAKEEKTGARILLTVLTFGAKVEVLFSSEAATDVVLPDLCGGGETPLGETLSAAKEILEDKKKIPSNSYRPTVVLVSDGKPTDEGWEDSLDRFIEEGRSSKCDRMAMAIGPDADDDVLGRFIKGTGHSLYEAEDASTIIEFFERVTMSVTVRSRSNNPNVIPKISSTVSIEGEAGDSIEELSDANSLGDASNEESLFW